MHSLLKKEKQNSTLKSDDSLITWNVNKSI